MAEFFELEIEGTAIEAEVVDEPIPAPDFPQVSRTQDPRADGTLAVSFFSVDAFARLILKKVTMTRSSSLPWVQIKISDGNGQVVKQAQVFRNELKLPAPSDETKQTHIDSSGLAPGVYRIDVYGIYGLWAALGGYAVFASAIQLSAEWGPVWGQVLAPDGPSELELRKSFYVQLA